MQKSIRKKHQNAAGGQQKGSIKATDEHTATESLTASTSLLARVSTIVHNGAFGSLLVLLVAVVQE